MKARVKSGSVLWPVTACSGKAEFIYTEWRDVPAGCEDEILAHPMLEVMREDEQISEPAAFFASMAAEKAAEKAGLDPKDIKGTGKDGAIRMSDVRDAIDLLSAETLVTNDFISAGMADEEGE